MGKKVVITADLVDESMGRSNGVIAEDLLRWFVRMFCPRLGLGRYEWLL